MTSYVALLRGINVGGKNLIGMAGLTECLEKAGHRDVRTYLQSGNVLFTADPAAKQVEEAAIERALEERFGFAIPVVLVTREAFAEVVAQAPPDHGSAESRSEVIFVKRPLTAESAFAQLPELRAGVDTVSLGPGVIYFSRLAAQASRTRITKIMAMPMYQQMTIRNWKTVTRLNALLDD